MCNKCEVSHELPQHVTPTTPMLERWVQLGGELNRDIRAHLMRDYIRGQHNTENIQYWSHGRRNWVEHKREHMRPFGQLLAKYKSAADKTATRDITDILEFNATYEYVRMLCHGNESVTNKAEPAYARVMQKNRSSEWELLDVMTKLHPFTTSSHNISDHQTLGNRYSKSATAFNELNLLHYVHISVEDMNQIAYYPTLQHLRQGREVRTRLGRYLTKYQEALQLTDSDIKSMAEKHQANMCARGGWAVNYVEHNDADGWLDVYNGDVSSCMQNEDAVRIYAHDKSQLRLAYVTAGDKIIARCIVRDDPDGEMTGWLRVYPDPNGYAEGRFLLDYLKVNGYPKQTNLDGALLRYINDNTGIVCPYLDYGSGGDQTVSVVERDGTKYLEAGGGDLDATLTGGYANDDMCDCAICGERTHEDDTSWIECDDQRVCDYCRDEHYTYAYGARYEDYFPSDDCVHVAGNWYYKPTIDNHDEVGYCDIDEEYYHIDDMVYTCDGWFHERHITSIDHEDSDGNTSCLRDNVHTLSDGTTCHVDDADKYEVELTEAVA